MSFIQGQTYPAAFFLFDCSQSPYNYLNYARESIQSCFSEIDPEFTGDSQILSGDLLPGKEGILSAMIKDPSFAIDITRLDTQISKKMSAGDYLGELYMIGILFVIPSAIDVIHSEMLDAGIEGYLGIFTIDFTAGTTDINILSNTLSVAKSYIGDRI